MLEENGEFRMPRGRSRELKLVCNKNYSGPYCLESVQK